MVVNFRAHEINRSAYKLIRTLTLIKKQKINNMGETSEGQKCIREKEG
jgi:hypothetical protein